MRVKTVNNYSNEFKTTSGLLQRYSTSLTLFKIILEQILRPWKSKCEDMWIPIRDSFFYTLNLAEDQVVPAQNEDEDLAYLLRKLEQEYKKNVLEINQAIPNTTEPLNNLEIDENKDIKDTEKCNYLGFAISYNRMTEQEITCRSAEARTWIKQMNGVL